jgi:hypothetical protein
MRRRLDMTPDPLMEAKLARLELVAGIGTRESGRLCVMSLVAWLAGEPHGDSPECASPLIRAFAIPLNDNMPPAVRQRLKPFAPRILGTADGRDAARAALLRDLMTGTLLPCIGSRLDGRGWWRRVRAIVGRRRLEREAMALLTRAGSLREAEQRTCAIAAAGATGRLVARAAREAPGEAEAARIWALGIAVLDRLCEPAAAPAVARIAETV